MFGALDTNSEVKMTKGAQQQRKDTEGYNAICRAVHCTAYSHIVHVALAKKYKIYKIR